MQDIEEKQDGNGEATPSHDIILPTSLSSPSISSALTSSLLSSTQSMESPPCRQPETSVFYAAVDSLLTSQQGRGELVEVESGKEEEAVVKDADETTAHTTTVPTPHVIPPSCDTDTFSLSPFCMPDATSETKPSPQFSPGSITASQRGVAGTKRKSKHGGGGSKQKHSRMMP